jgi:hypothetical protein
LLFAARCGALHAAAVLRLLPRGHPKRLATTLELLQGLNVLTLQGHKRLCLLLLLLLSCM